MRRSRAGWELAVAEFEGSGESHEEFCARRRLTVGTFRSWLYQLRREVTSGKVAGGATRMVPVHVRATSAVRDDGVIEITLPRAVVRVPFGAPPDYVASLVAALTRAC
jgi:hypothetical protein